MSLFKVKEYDRDATIVTERTPNCTLESHDRVECLLTILSSFTTSYHYFSTFNSIISLILCFIYYINPSFLFTVIPGGHLSKLVSAWIELQDYVNCYLGTHTQAHTHTCADTHTHMRRHICKHPPPYTHTLVYACTHAQIKYGTVERCVRRHISHHSSPAIYNIYLT